VDGEAVIRAVLKTQRARRGAESGYVGAKAREVLMITHASRSRMGGMLTGVLAGLLLMQPTAGAQGPAPVPAKVMGALKARFPMAEIQKWTREKEKGVVLYDIEFQQEGRHFEADIREDGVIDNWERAIAAADLPEAVTQVVAKKYPNSTMKQVMAVTEVRDGEDVLQGYEITLQTADKKSVEVTVAPDGKILEDSGGS
jgi:uncharacterized membrane protein YkoI